MNVLHRLSVGFLVLITVVGCGSNPPGQSPATVVVPDVSTSAVPEIVLPISPEELAKDYEADENSADTRYKGQYVAMDAPAVSMPRVNGPGVVSIGFKGTMKGDVPATSVVASFKGTSFMKVLNTSEGQRLKLRGRVDGKMGATVYLADAVLLEAGPDPALSVTVAELGKDFSADAAAAKQKYANRVVRIEGKVRTIDYVELKLVLEAGSKEPSSNACPVFAVLSLDWRNEGFASIAPGQTIALRGKVMFAKGDQFTLTQMVRVR